MDSAYNLFQSPTADAFFPCSFSQPFKRSVCILMTAVDTSVPSSNVHLGCSKAAVLEHDTKLLASLIVARVAVLEKIVVAEYCVQGQQRY